MNLNELPERRLSVRQIISLHPGMQIGEAVIISQRNMAMQLATKIMERDDFFTSTGANYGGVSALEYRADCIVLTAEEFREVRRQAFKEGAEHAQGFIRSYK